MKYNKSELKRVVFEALGHTSVASWSEEPKGIFQDQEVTKIGDKLVEDILNLTAEPAPMLIKQAIHILQAELLNDEGYKIGWTANIAMAYKDTESQYRKKNNKKYLNSKDKHIIANQAAEYFINQLCKS